MTTIERDQAYVANTYNRFPVCFTEGKGATLRDESGREYIDFSSGIGVNSLGFCDPNWAAAVANQASTLQHTSNLYYTKPCVDLAEQLCEKTFAKKVFFANSGAEANEGMIKLARKYSHDKYGGGRATIIALENSFHGRTMATLSATGQDVFHHHFFPFLSGFRFVAANDFTAMHEALEQGDVCGVLLEMIQGEGGVVPLDKVYVQRVAELCGHKDVLLLADEVQTGVGRTGAFLCHEQMGIVPDAASLAKGIGGGLPLGAVLIGEKCKSVLGAGDHATTFGGNPVCCAGALTVMERLTPDFLSQVTEKGAYLKRELEKLPHVKSVEGLGLMLGVTLEEGCSSRDMAAQCLEEGLVVLTAKTKLRLLPPLIVSKKEMDKGLKIMKEVLTTWHITC